MGKPKPIHPEEFDQQRHDDGPKPQYHHEWDYSNGATCFGVKTVMVPLRTGESPYSVRCDDRSHLHPVLVCKSPEGRERRFEFFKPAGWVRNNQDQSSGLPGCGHKHPWDAPEGKGECELDLSHFYPEGEFRRERIPALQIRFGKPKAPRPPEPPPPIQPPPGFKQVGAGLTVGTALHAPAAPPAAERQPLRTWTQPEAEKPATAPVDDGWADEDIPF